MGRGSDRPEKLPRMYRARDSKYWRVDLRPWNLGRMVMRDPRHPAWPQQGETTEFREIAAAWLSSYYDLCRQKAVRRAFGLPKHDRLGKAVDAYLTHREVAVERATWQNSKSATALLIEEFGREREIGTIREPEIQGLANKLLRRGYAASTLGTYRNQWASFFLWLGPYNPTAEIELPNPGSDDVDTLSDDELGMAREASDWLDQRSKSFPYRRALELGLGTGLRQGELFALPWSAFNEEERTIRVQVQVPKDRTIPKPLKGKKARTVLVLPSWWAHHAPDEGLVLPGPNGIYTTRPQRNAINRIFDTARINRQGWGWHVLRHTYARLFLESGGSMLQLQKSLGHASVQTTEQRYGHMEPDMAASLARRAIYG